MVTSTLPRKPTASKKAAGTSSAPVPSSTPSSERPYPLQKRTMAFAKDVRAFVSKLPKDIAMANDAKQLLYASGSVGANYLEADAAFSFDDFIMRMKICRREAQETGYWLQLLDVNLGAYLEKRRTDLLQESKELTLIFNSIVRKSLQKDDVKTEKKSS